MVCSLELEMKNLLPSGQVNPETYDITINVKDKDNNPVGGASVSW